MNTKHGSSNKNTFYQNFCICVLFGLKNEAPLVFDILGWYLQQTPLCVLAEAGTLLSPLVLNSVLEYIERIGADNEVAKNPSFRASI